jgi:hypothetical protein
LTGRIVAPSTTRREHGTQPAPNAFRSPLNNEEAGHVDDALRDHGHRRRYGNGAGYLDGAFGAENALVIPAAREL